MGVMEFDVYEGKEQKLVVCCKLYNIKNKHLNHFTAERCKGKLSLLRQMHRDPSGTIARMQSASKG